MQKLVTGGTSKRHTVARETIGLMNTLGRQILGHPLTSLGWYFEFSNTKKAIGDCHGTKKRIRISEQFLRLSMEALEDTIRHEIAHAIDYEIRGTSDHSYRWKRIAMQCGADPTRTKHVPPSARPAAKYTAKCPRCGTESQYHRRPKRRKACASCCRKYAGGRFDERFEFRFRANW